MCACREDISRVWPHSGQFVVSGIVYLQGSDERNTLCFVPGNVAEPCVKWLWSKFIQHQFSRWACHLLHNRAGSAPALRLPVNMPYPKLRSLAVVEPCNTSWTQRKRLELNGVRYEIAAFQSTDGSFRATWSCGHCQEKGAWVPISGDAKEIIHQAEIGVRVHHVLVHRNVVD